MKLMWVIEEYDMIVSVNKNLIYIYNYIIKYILYIYKIFGIYYLCN